MKGSDIFSIAVLILIALIILGYYMVNLKNAKANIEKYLSKRGATNINIYHVWFDDDRDTLTFEVAYTGIKGNKLTTRCKIQHWSFSVDDDIYWFDPLGLELMQIPPELPRSKYYELSEKLRSHLSVELPTYEISTVLTIPNSDDLIAMMKYIAAFNNVFRCKPDGSIVWQAELPTATGDVYTNIAWKDKYLTAFSRSLITTRLDVETGKILPMDHV